MYYLRDAILTTCYMKKCNYLLVTFLLMFIGPLMLAQQKEVSGTVTDSDDQPLPGVNIVVEDTGNGTQTDFDGNYSIDVEVGQVLKFTYVGMQDETREVGDSNSLNVQMQEASELDEVVVTAFGRTTTRNESTSNVSTVQSEDLVKVPVVSTQEALQGKAPGLKVNNTSGVPGSEPQVRIRGQNSITAGNDPLYVVDGVPVRSGNIGASSDETSIGLFSLINSNDIESMSVLKDAAAVAPYGAEGSNGVILVTTKSGQEGEPKYNLNYSVSVENPAIRGLRMMDSDQRYGAWKQATLNGFGDAFGLDGDLGEYDVDDDTFEDLLLNGVGLDDIQHWKDLGKPDEDWYNAVRNKNAITHNVNFSVSKGDKNNSLYASVGYNHSEGTVIASDYERITGNIKYDTKLGDDFDLSISGRVANAKQDGVLEEAAFFSNPNLAKYFIPHWVPAFNEDGSPNISDDFSTYAGGLFNTVYTQNNDILKNNVTRAMQNTKLSWDIADDLKFTTRLGLDYTLRHYDRFQNSIHGDGKDAQGAKNEEDSRRFNYTSQNTLDYDFTLGDKNNFEVTGVHEFTKYRNKGLQGYGENFPGDLSRLDVNPTANDEAYSSYEDRMSMRFVGLVNYDYDKRYLINASYSYQGDSRFSDRWGSFYSVSGGWNIHEEDFMSRSDFVDELRLKVGYGRTGNADVGINKYQALLGFDQYGGAPGAVTSTFGTNATWEKSDRLDISADFGFFGGRLSGTVDFFNNETKDMLYQSPLPYSATFITDDGDDNSHVLRNEGKMRNRGVEFEVDGDIIDTPDWKWNLGFNIATVSTKVTEMPSDAETLGTKVRSEGHKLDEWHMPEWAGVDPDNGDPLWYVDRSENDETTNNYNEAEEQFVGKSPQPKYTGGISTHIEFKNFFVDGELYFSGGNKVYEDWATYTQATGVQMTGMNSSLEAYENAWREPGDEATYPRFDFNSGTVDDATKTSTRFLYDGTFLRLRGVGIGYTFDEKLLGNLPVDNLSLSVRGTNLWTWVKDNNLKHDPEVRVNGYTNLATPATKTVTFNVNVNF